MGVPFDYAPDRPEHIDTILNGLDRYNPETTTVFQDYVTQQCEDQKYDCYANLALLKLWVPKSLKLVERHAKAKEIKMMTNNHNVSYYLTGAGHESPSLTEVELLALSERIPQSCAHIYQFNPHLTQNEVTTNILVKALTVFPSPDFSLCLSLLPPHLLAPQPPADSLAEMVQALSALNRLLCAADYTTFWETLESDDLYADLISDVVGFEEIMRVRIAVVVSQSVQELERAVLESWLNMKGDAFEKFVREICGWAIEDSRVKVPLNKENEAKGTIVRENVKFDQFSRMIRRAYEQPA
ncbi:hypothetical protein LTR66_001309 [Elasticomyces elasticus]|nr:hypothetical protein LTR66_001309 [Elasticomyces elasticus]